LSPEHENILAFGRLRSTARLFASLIALSPAFFFSIGNPALAEDIVIGLRAHSGIEKSLLQWQPTIDYAQ